MGSGSLPTLTHTAKSLGFADDALGPTPEDQNARGRVNAKKGQNRQVKPEEGKEEKKKGFVIRQSFDNTGRELISLASTTLRGMNKQDIEASAMQGRVLPSRTLLVLPELCC